MAMEFSIEMAAQRIVINRTREYFDEVKGCYYSGYYRSCMVMLWSVVVCDLLYKLDLLANLHGDQTAKGILTEIESDRKSNPNSPKWEEKLLHLLKDRTEMFDPASFLSLQTLQQYRHLSAHPVLSENNDLFAPTQEIARANLRAALECLLTRPAMLSRKVFDAFLEDLEANSRVLINDETMITYIANKYGPHLTDAVQSDLFRRMWKIVFRASDQRCNANRVVNFRALCALYERRPSEMDVVISKNPEFFGDCRFIDGLAEALAGFLRRYPHVYKLLNLAAQKNVENFVSQDIDQKATAWYLSESPVAHVHNVLFSLPNDREIKPATFKLIVRQLSKENDVSPAIKYAIDRYAQSDFYRTADQRFEALVRPVIEYMCLTDFNEFMTKCELNRQTYARGTADHLAIKERLDIISEGNFDYGPFPKMLNSMTVEPDASVESFI